MFKLHFRYQVIGLAVMFLMMCASLSRAATSAQLNYNPGNIFTTSVSDTTTACGRTYLSGSRQPQADIWGNKFTSSAFQIYAIDSSATMNSMDFWYSYGMASTQNLWKGSWGPMQRNMTLPTDGFYVSPTFTVQGAISIIFESMQ